MSAPVIIGNATLKAAIVRVFAKAPGVAAPGYHDND